MLLILITMPCNFSIESCTPYCYLQQKNILNANTCVIGHNSDVFIYLVDERLDQAVDVAAVFRYIVS